MKRRLFWTIATLTSLFAVLMYTPFVENAVSLLVFGIVPNSTNNVPSWVMFAVYPLLFTLGIIWLSRQTLYIGEIPAKKQPTRRRNSKKPIRSQTRGTTQKPQKVATAVTS